MHTKIRTLSVETLVFVPARLNSETLVFVPSRLNSSLRLDMHISPGLSPSIDTSVLKTCAPLGSPATCVIQSVYPRRQNVTTSMVGLKKTVTCAKISLEMVKPRDISGERRRRRRSIQSVLEQLDPVSEYCVLYFCICTCSAQLSMFHMERRSRKTLIIIIIIIIITVTG